MLMDSKYKKTLSVTSLAKLVCGWVGMYKSRVSVCGHGHFLILVPQYPFLLLPVTEPVLALGTCSLPIFRPYGLVSCLNPLLWVWAYISEWPMRKWNPPVHSDWFQKRSLIPPVGLNSGFGFVLTFGRLRDGLPGIQISAWLIWKWRKKWKKV